MQEWQLYSVWEYYAQTRQQLVSGKNSLIILYPGQLNAQKGPDYAGARFILNNVEYCGYVEIHVNVSDWYKHHHHLDPSYQHVLLHIVSEESETDAQVSHTLAHEKIPTFRLMAPVNKSTLFKCVSKKFPADILYRLQKLALKRFRYKAHQFEKSLQLLPLDQVFYSAFFRSLGYPNNKNIFEMLSQRVSLNTTIEEPLELLALLFGAAGFLDKTFNDIFSLKIQTTFLRMSKMLSFAPLHSHKWQMAGVRPLNHPEFRLAGWVALISVYNASSLFDYFYDLLQERHSFPLTMRAMQNVFRIETDFYWKSHYALEKKLQNHNNSYYFGLQRIKEFITNIILPLAVAKAQRLKNPGFVSYLEEFYLWIPGKSNYSSIFLRNPWLKDYLAIWNNFNAGQAFIELETNYCRAGLCKQCPIDRKFR